MPLPGEDGTRLPFFLYRFSFFCLENSVTRMLVIVRGSTCAIFSTTVILWILPAYKTFNMLDVQNDTIEGDTLSYPKCIFMVLSIRCVY